MRVWVKRGIDGDVKVEVREVDDLRQLDVVAEDVGLLAVSDALSHSGLGLAIASEGYAWLSIAGLRRAAHTNATLADWDTQWENMITYAVRNGWVSSDGESVRAHLS